MTRNKRRIILALFSVLIIIILACVFIILYKTTDSFKSEKTLFTKYFGKSIENVQNFYEDIIMPCMNNAINKNKLISFLEDKIKECEKEIEKFLDREYYCIALDKKEAFQEVLDFVNKGGKE